MEQTKFEKKQIVKEIQNAIDNDFDIDTASDEECLRNEKYSWDDLATLKDELGNAVLEFVMNMQYTLANDDVISNLGERAGKFNKLVEIFFKDINEFSDKVKKTRIEHDGKTGLITNINEFNLYNRLAITYHSLYTELSTLVAPTMSELVLIIAEIHADQQEKLSETEPAVTEVTNNDNA